MTFNLYEGLNYERNNKYDKFNKVIDPFFIKSYLNKRKNKIIAHQTRMAKPFGDNSIEMKIIDSSLIKEIEKFKNKEIFINRYILTWGTDKRYFLKQFNCFPIFFDDNIIIFEFGNKFNIVYENDLNLTLKQLLRNNKLSELLNG
jgi:hypothetical protein